jgi:peptidoglycan pentaglycine glycine transferase (the second and third glycine)
MTDKDKFIPVAAAMFVFWPNETVYLYSGSSSKYTKYGGPHFLQYKMISDSIKRGVEKYNFYGTNPKKGDGVYEFKRGYHGELQEYIGTYMLPISLIGKIYAKKQKYKDVRDIH